MRLKLGDTIETKVTYPSVCMLSATLNTWESVRLGQELVNIGSWTISNQSAGKKRGNFASNLLENTEDLDPEFSKAIDENYWDLI